MVWSQKQSKTVQTENKLERARNRPIQGKAAALPNQFTVGRCCAAALISILTPMPSFRA